MRNRIQREEECEGRAVNALGKFPYTRKRPTPRGIKNDNPGNIRWSHAMTWDGESGTDNNGFVIFSTPADGLRALATLLTTYQVREHIHTVTDLVERYAPAGVVLEDSYAGFISEVVGVGRTERIDIIALMPLIMRAMIWFENGQNPYAWWAINNAVEDIVSGGPKQGNP